MTAYGCCTHCADQVHIATDSHTLPCSYPTCAQGHAHTKETRMTQPDLPPTAVPMQIHGGRHDGAHVAVIDTSDLALAVIVDPDGHMNLQTKMEPQDTLTALQAIAELYANTHSLTIEPAPVPASPPIPDIHIEHVAFTPDGGIETTFSYTAPDGSRRHIEYVGPANATIVPGL